VRRAPCRNGARRRDPDGFARFDGAADDAEAVPYPAVASAPALQCVITRLSPEEQLRPWRPMRRHASCSAGDRVGLGDESPASHRGECRTPGSARRRSSDAKRLTAVGRVAARRWRAVSKRSAGGVVSPLRIENAAPYDAATPIAGAPRTAMSRMASAISGAFDSVSQASRAGRSRWSSSRRTSPSR
jgi:hypothetical protein